MDELQKIYENIKNKSTENKCCGSKEGFETLEKGNKKCKSCGRVYSDLVDKL